MASEDYVRERFVSEVSSGAALPVSMSSAHSAAACEMRTASL